jgi:uncharacterized protein
VKIDLRKLYTLNNLQINNEITIPKEKYTNMGIIRMSEVNVIGKIMIDYDNNINVNLEASGTMIMPCAISLEEVEVPFKTHIEETIEENTLNDQIALDLFDILWENIVLEIPIRVIKKGIQRKDLQGKGWKLESEE